MFGYRVREEPIKIKWAQKVVEVKIRNIEDPVFRRRTKAAFDYLMSKSNCSYRKFIQMHWSHVQEPWIFELFFHPAFHRVETALWPHLYHENKHCESFLEGQETRKCLSWARSHQPSEIMPPTTICCTIIMTTGYLSQSPEQSIPQKKHNAHQLQP